jgi:membrane-associated protease RseP (regulator of RpoE activity)
MSEDQNLPAQGTARQLEGAVAGLFAVDDVTLGMPGKPDAIRLRGRLQVSSETAYPQIASRFKQMGYTALLRNDADGEHHILVAVPGLQPETSRSRPWLNGLLYLLTILATLFVGATWSDMAPPDADLGWILTHLWIGWPFALSLMTILTGHELGHYFAGRYYGVPVSLPYFIPMPVPPLGTMGAFIVMKGQTLNRRQMLTVGAAGPLVGFVLAVPILILGLSLSTVEPMSAPQAGSLIFLEGNSLLYLLLKLAVFGQVLPGSGAALTAQGVLGELGAALVGSFPIDRGFDVFISPVALAGWAGLLVTALNLLPVGQLDGGHVLYSLIGQRARILTWPIIGILVVLGLVFWQGWLLWALLIFFFGQSHPDPLDDVTRLDLPRKLVAVSVLLVFALTFSPLPMRVVAGDLPALEGDQTLGCLTLPGLVVGLSIWLGLQRWIARRAMR